jgi:hypothetical protein
MNDLLKGTVAILVFITVAGVALAFMPNSQLTTTTAPPKPSARQVAEASWTAARDRIRSECMGGRNADALPPALFKQLLDSCDHQAAEQIGPEDYWVSEEMKLEALEAQQQASSGGEHDDAANATPSP